MTVIEGDEWCHGPLTAGSASRSFEPIRLAALASTSCSRLRIIPNDHVKFKMHTAVWHRKNECRPQINCNLLERKRIIQTFSRQPKQVGDIAFQDFLSCYI